MPVTVFCDNKPVVTSLKDNIVSFATTVGKEYSLIPLKD
jgi:hypothetical protein